MIIKKLVTFFTEMTDIWSIKLATTFTAFKNDTNYFILFLTSRYKEYIYYALYLVSSSIFIGYSYGMLTHYFHVFGTLSLYLNATVLISPIFLALFIKVIFNTNKNYATENAFLNTVVVIFGLAYIYSFYNYYSCYFSRLFR